MPKKPRQLQPRQNRTHDFSHAALLTRLESALASPNPTAATHSLAISLRDAGLPQPDLLALFNTARAQHQNDPDESLYDAILDILDCIVGWCSPHAALYPRSPLYYPSARPPEPHP